MAAKWAGIVNRNLFFALCAFPLLPLHWISMVVIALLLSGMFQLRKNSPVQFDQRFFWVMLSPVVVFVLFLPFTNNSEQALRSISVKLVLVALGLLYAFVGLRATKGDAEKGFVVLALASVALIAWTWIQMLVLGFTHPVGFQGADFTYSYRVSLEEYSGLHPTYYCAIVYMVAFIQAYQWVYKQGKLNRWIQLLLVVVCTLAGLMAASRATMVAFGIIMVIMLVGYLRSHPLRWWYAGALVAVMIGLLFVPPIQNRLLEVNSANLQAPSGNNDNGTNVRAGIFSCNASLIQEHWLLGVGPGDVQSALNECLSKFETHVYQIHDYNTHNEYVNYWLTCGIVGLLLFVGVLGYSIWMGIKHHNPLHIYFIVFMGICFLTENYLDRQAGVTFFALMQVLFWMGYSKQTENQ